MTEDNTPEVNEDTVSALRKLLSMAMDGKLVGITTALLYENGHAGYTVAGEFNTETLGALAILEAMTVEKIRAVTIDVYEAGREGGMN